MAKKKSNLNGKYKCTNGYLIAKRKGRDEYTIRRGKWKGIPKYARNLPEYFGKSLLSTFLKDAKCRKVSRLPRVHILGKVTRLPRVRKNVKEFLANKDNTFSPYRDYGSK